MNRIRAVVAHADVPTRILSEMLAKIDVKHSAQRIHNWAKLDKIQGREEKDFFSEDDWDKVSEALRSNPEWEYIFTGMQNSRDVLTLLGDVPAEDTTSLAEFTEEPESAIAPEEAADTASTDDDLDDLLDEDATDDDDLLEDVFAGLETSPMGDADPLDLYDDLLE